MEIRTMRYFLAVAREENMTRAAEYLHVSQPTLSKQMQSLEEELGYLLTFDRLIDTSRSSGLVFRPLTPRLEAGIYLVWRKRQIFLPLRSVCCTRSGTRFPRGQRRQGNKGGQTYVRKEEKRGPVL